jgi:predicted glycosyl hydrolase (DUF1957 family)
MTENSEHTYALTDALVTNNMIMNRWRQVDKNLIKKFVKLQETEYCWINACTCKYGNEPFDTIKDGDFE